MNPNIVLDHFAVAEPNSINSSNLKRLHLMFSDHIFIDSGIAFWGCKALQHVVFDKDSYGWNVHAKFIEKVTQVILQSARNSLESLSIIGFEDCEEQALIRDDAGDLSFGGCARLKDVRTSGNLFWDEKPKGALAKEWIVCGTKYVHRLAYVLPASRQRLEIDGFVYIDIIPVLL